MPSPLPYTFRRKTDGVASSEAQKVERGYEVYLKAQNLTAEADRLGKLPQAEAFLHNRLRSMPGKAVWWPVVLSALEGYRKARQQASGPLRFKKAARLHTIPCVGPLAALQRKGAVKAYIQREAHGFTVHSTVRTARPHFDEAGLKKRAYHHKNILDAGLCATREGLHVREQTLDGRVRAYLIPAELVMLPMAPQEILNTVLRGRALTVTLDPSLVPTLSSPMQEAIRRLHRWMRARKAVGAVAYRKVASLGEVTRMAAEGLRGSEAATPLFHSASTRHCEDCPTCGAPELLNIDPITGFPTLAAGTCSTCGTARNIGGILANRALTLGMHKRTQAYANLWAPGCQTAPRPHQQPK